MGHPLLHSVAVRIDNPSSGEWKKLARAMIATMQQAHGVGLAAPQVGQTVRLFVMQEQQEEEAQTLINPVWTPVSDEKELALEGCLSMPHLRGIVTRYKKIFVQATTLDGKHKEFIAQDLKARIIQHECDHLNGVLFHQHIEDFALFGFEDELLLRFKQTQEDDHDQ